MSPRLLKAAEQPTAPSRPCAFCGRPMPGANGHRKYCSNRCSNDAEAPHYVRPGEHSWQGWYVRRRNMGLDVGYRVLVCMGDLLLRDGLGCAICGGEMDFTTVAKWDSAEIDHIIPVREPFSYHEKSNLQVVHSACNRAKG
jgi:hypothetical protein